MPAKIIFQRGVTLVELMLALATAALLMVGLSSAISQGLQAKSYAHNANEMSYAARFALSRIVANTRLAASIIDTTSTANQLTCINLTTPVLHDVAYTYTPATATTPGFLTENDNMNSSTVVADNVTAFVVTKLGKVPTPASYGAIKAGAALTPEVAKIALTLSTGGQSITVVAFSRVGPL